jgi:16S rRNA A1518/A1519 N6-dimethyltransferase RsmA/KsgA/DIM1 with predicted DNA glycosylase/AP lyase activity
MEAQALLLCQAEVDLQRRAETLTLEEWARIINALVKRRALPAAGGLEWRDEENR